MNTMGKPGKGRILFVVGSLAVGGTETQLALLSEGLIRRGWAVEIFLLEKSGGLIERVERTGVQVTDGGYTTGPGSKLRKLVSVVGCELRLVWLALRSRPGVMHGFLPLANFMSALAGWITFIPLVVTSKRALGNHQGRMAAWKWLDRMANALSHVITANSQAVADDTEARDGYEASRIVVIPNGLDFTRIDAAAGYRDEARDELGLSPSDVAIVMVANLIHYKGHLDLIEAFARVASGDPRLKLFLIGQDRGVAKDLISRANQLGVTDRISLMGSRDDVPRLLSGMDLGVLSSHEEGFSNALLEKLAAGLPVVATDAGGNREALAGMPDCVLVRPHDAHDLARGLRQVIAGLGADDRNRTVRQTSIHERYSVDAMVDAYERIYLHPR